MFCDSIITPKVLLTDLPNDTQRQSISRGLRRIGQDGLINERTIMTCLTAETDIMEGDNFTALRSAQEQPLLINISASLQFIYINQMRMVHRLDKGSSGVCLIEFSSSIPAVLSKLKPYGVKRDKEIHEMFYLL